MKREEWLQVGLAALEETAKIKCESGTSIRKITVNTYATGVAR